MTREEAIKRLEWLEMVAEHVDSVTIGSKCTEDWEAYNMAIAALREQPQWISVEDRLPEAFVSVLVYMPEERPLPTVHEGYVTNNGKWYAHFFEREPFEVTHWMPLPEPPEEEV